MGKLHTERDDELEAKDQSIFGRVVMLAGIALLIILLAALLFVKRAGRHIEPVNPDKHVTSQVVRPTNDWLV
jgi:hypothetical protein